MRARPALTGPLAVALVAALLIVPLPDETTPPAPVPGRAPPVVVTLGDSVPAGTACGCEPFPGLYAQRLAPDAISVDLAEPGTTAADVRALTGQAGTRAALRRATVVLVMTGANDFAAHFPGGADPDYRAEAAEVRTDVEATVRQIRVAAGAAVPVFVLGYWNVVADGDAAGFDPPDTAEAAVATTYADQALQQAAAATAAAYVPTTAVFKGPSGTGNPSGLLAPDGDHPNARGHAAIAAAIPLPR